MAEALANEFTTTLAVAIDADDDSLTLATAPPVALAGGNFRLRIGAPGDNQVHEYVLVGTVAGAVLSGVARAEEGTTAQPWNTGTRVAQVLTVAGLIAVVADAHYVHTQAVALSIWTVVHNLGKFPSVSIVDSAGTVVYGAIDYVNDNELTISFVSAFGGRAYLN